MKIIVTGTTGFLGSRIAKALREEGHVIYSLTRDIADITDYKAVRKFVKGVMPDLVIHAAAMADIKACEDNKELAEKVNIIGTGCIASACADFCAKMLYISSDQVYDYYKSNVLKESIEPSPTNHYGYTKLAGEIKTQSLVPKSYIFRITWQYSGIEEGFKTMGLPDIIKNSIEKGTPISIGKDSRRYITYVYDTIEAIKLAVNTNIPYGIYNIASTTEKNAYEQTAYIMKALGASEQEIKELIKIDESYKTISLLPEPHNLKLCGYQMPTFEEGFQKWLIGK